MTEDLWIDMIQANEKSKKSICKDCKNNQGFNGKYYDCNKSDYVSVDYERDGSLFYTKIIKCDGFDEK